LFLSLNHCLLALILGKVGFDSRVVKFFSNYLVDRKTKYFWNNFSSSQFDINMRVGQGSALSPIFFALYIVATTRSMSNSSTTSKSLRLISSREYELCNLQENSIGNHNSILPTIYIKYPWSMLWLHICCAFYPNVHALSSYPITHPPYVYLKASILYTYALTSYSKPYSSSPSSMCAPYVHYEETMLLTCSLTSLNL